MRLSNLPIAAKMLLVVALMAVLPLGLTANSAWQMSKIDASYSQLTGQDGPALVKMARVNRQVSSAMYAAYRVFAYDGASAEARAAAEDKQKAIKSAHALLGEVKAMLPEHAEHIAEIDGRVTQVEKILSRAVAAGLVNDNAAATAALQEADKAVAGLTADLTKFNDARIADNARASDANSAAVSGTIMLGWGVSLVGLIAAAAVAIWLVRSQITGPLNRLADRMAKLSGGDLSVDVEGADRRDEVGAMARSVLVFKENGLRLKDTETEAARQAAATEAQRLQIEADREAAARELATVVQSLAGGLSAMAEGDLTVNLSKVFTAEYEQLRHDFNGAVSKLRDTLGVISTAGDGIQAGASEISTAADDLSRRTEQQAASLEETAAALDQITATVRKTAEAANEARGVVAGAKSDAEKSEQVVLDAVGAMEQIEGSSRQISTIIGVIDEIAFQTNLLALNAGVEAARAGEAGKGFAVVASEVRALAQRSAEAAKEIKGLISTSGEQVKAGVELVGSTGEALSRILRHVTQINGLVTDIAASAQEQATGLQQVNTAVNQMDQVTQQNAAMVEEATAAARSLSDESRNMNDLIARFRLGTESTPRAAAPTAARKAVPQMKPMQQAMPVAAPAAMAAPVAAAAPSSAPVTFGQPAEAADDWTEF